MHPSRAAAEKVNWSTRGRRKSRFPQPIYHFKTGCRWYHRKWHQNQTFRSHDEKRSIRLVAGEVRLNFLEGWVFQHVLAPAHQAEDDDGHAGFRQRACAAHRGSNPRKRSLKRATCK